MNYKRTAPETGASSENYSGASTVSTTARDYSTPIVIRWWEYPALLLRLVVIAAAIIVWAFAFEVGANINSAAFRFEVRQPLIELKRDIKDYRDKYHGESKDSYAKQKSDRSTWQELHSGTGQEELEALMERIKEVRAQLTMAAPEKLIGILFTWMWTNLLILSLCAVLVGELGRMDIDPRSQPLLFRIQKSIPRALFIYFFVLFGQFIYVGNLEYSQFPADVDQFHYLKLASLTTLACFLSGMRPGFFIALVRLAETRVEDHAKSRTQSNDNSTT